MSKSIRCQRLNHVNVVFQDFDASVQHLRARYGADFLLDLPQREWHACLMEMGRVIFELFVPYEFLTNARYGPHFLGAEYQANMDEVRAAIAAHDIRIVRDIGLAVHTHPADCFGIAFEFYEGYFHDNDWPLLGGKMKTAAFWRNEHPLGLTGLEAMTVAVENLEAASGFLQSFVSAEKIHDAPRSSIGARAAGLQLADSVIELVTPSENGILARHLRRYGEGIRSIVFGVRSLEQARRYFGEGGLEIVEGSAPGRIAVPAEVNRGVIFEFSE